MKIGERLLAHQRPAFVIAEIGVNHEGSLELAKAQIAQAARGGADAVKFQSYKAETIAIVDSPAYWDQSKEPTESQYALFKKYDGFGPEHYRALADCSRECGVAFMSTPFDLQAVQYLDPLVPAFKLASADITNVPLIRACAATGKPLLMSTGAATLDEVAFALQTARAAGASDIALLHCVLNYPTPAADAAIGYIATLRDAFPDCCIGYSDHVVPDETLSALEAATLLGALVLEKHFTHDKSLPGNDHYHAMDEQDLTRFRDREKHFRLLIGNGDKDLAGEALARKHARRSIVTGRAIAAGELLDETNLTTKRPAHGISPIHWDEVLGSRASCDIPADTALQDAMIAGRE